ncbi:MAG: hypothetical protein R3B49_01205 [Phycisphaerales bacterium]
MEDTLLANQGQINQTSFSPSPTTATGIVDDASVFRVGDLIRPAGSGEVMLATTVDVINAIEVARYVGGTTAATLANNMVLEIDRERGRSRRRAADGAVHDARWQNYTQILTSAVVVSGSMQARGSTGSTTRWIYQKQERGSCATWRTA